jgi:hypothetical protein
MQKITKNLLYKKTGINPTKLSIELGLNDLELSYLEARIILYLSLAPKLNKLLLDFPVSEEKRKMNYGQQIKIAELVENVAKKIDSEQLSKAKQHIWGVLRYLFNFTYKNFPAAYYYQAKMLLEYLDYKPEIAMYGYNRVGFMDAVDDVYFFINNTIYFPLSVLKLFDIDLIDFLKKTRAFRWKSKPAAFLNQPFDYFANPTTLLKIYKMETGNEYIDFYNKTNHKFYTKVNDKRKYIINYPELKSTFYMSYSRLYDYCLKKPATKKSLYIPQYALQKFLFKLFTSDRYTESINKWRSVIDKHFFNSPHYNILNQFYYPPSGIIFTNEVKKLTARLYNKTIPIVGGKVSKNQTIKRSINYHVYMYIYNNYPNRIYWDSNYYGKVIKDLKEMNTKPLEEEVLRRWQIQS